MTTSKENPAKKITATEKTEEKVALKKVAAKTPTKAKVKLNNSSALLASLVTLFIIASVDSIAQAPLKSSVADSNGNGCGVMLCTRVLWNNNSLAVISGRSADWLKADKPEDTDRSGASHPKLHVLPRGLSKTGDVKSGDAIDNPATWISRYGSVIVVNKNAYVFDGMNEKGLAAHALALNSEYGIRDLSRKGIHSSLLVPYILDNATTVEEALALIPQIQPVAVLVDGYGMPLSLTIEDRFGNSAVVEWPKVDPPYDPTFVPERIVGGAYIYKGQNVRVMGNEDLAGSHLEQQAKWPYDVDTATRKTDIPGNAWRSFRWARASFYSDFLSRMTPRTVLEARAALMSVIRNISNPIGAPGDDGGPSGRGDETDWRTLSDLTNLEYIFDNPRTLTTITTDLKQLDFQPAAGIRMLDPSNPDLHGNVTRLYRPISSPVPGVVSSLKSLSR
jgi:penicillin V acylase-like amidase (Ntn superfamily)